MNTPGLEQLQQFIASNNIPRVNDTLAFEGIIYFSRNDNRHIINSGVQIVLFPERAAVYILKFLQEDYGQNEIYSTSAYQFKCTDDNALHITDATATTRIIISLPMEL